MAAPIMASATLQRSASNAKPLFTVFNTTYNDKDRRMTSRYIKVSLTKLMRKRNSFSDKLLYVAAMLSGIKSLAPIKFTDITPNNITTIYASPATLAYVFIFVSVKTIYINIKLFKCVKQNKLIHDRI